MLSYLSKIKKIADNRIEEFSRIGHAIEGCNGPYNNNDTPIRNSAHWIVVYGFLYENYKEKKYLEVLAILAEYLVKNDNFGDSGAIICRKDKNCDDTNGLIGQAWAIEGLITAYKILREKAYYEKAVSIFFTQEFDEKICLWRIVEGNGNNTGLDWVYNHQLWFAAAGSLIIDVMFNEKIDTRIRAFLGNYRVTFGVQPSGLIYHLINNKNKFVNNAKFGLKMLLTDLCLTKKYKELAYLEKGYHLFNLFGFALLYNKYKNADIFKSLKFKRSLKYGVSLINELGENEENFNKYSYAYNSPAFEYPFISRVFHKDDELVYEKLLKIHDHITFSDTTLLYDRNNHDPETLTARMYELIRYYQISHIKNKRR
ncbi:hypothetical protein PU629_03210 [Pullulanibacillus sp. KACC 23026]|uniref:hypothetical protein n=1 Tax=Pullulanibacillus sp. KACC 23026 TaxID=3028315 RepID=UPI0023AFDBBC|nr:hypothetical protein [Pullulanibacillus sp. KACC 23026]WEG13391.1 hypothetical protein PU629_03210 [Pullulanibacillus sp. KACC 23026]